MAAICCLGEVRVESVECLSAAELAGVFTSRERRLTSGRAFPAEGLAARLAAKKAFLSALFQLGWQRPFPWTAFEIGSSANGRPDLRVLDKNLQRIVGLNIDTVFVSLSHTQDTGCAAVAVEWGGGIA